jgi:hypothetical protein
MGKLMACSQTISALQAFFDTGEEIDVPHTVKDSSQRADSRISAPMLWLWDAWRRGDWVQIRAAYDSLRKDWQRMFQSTESAFMKLDQLIQYSTETNPVTSALDSK